MIFTTDYQDTFLLNCYLWFCSMIILKAYDSMLLLTKID